LTFWSGSSKGMFRVTSGLAQMELELAASVVCKVDLRTPQELSRRAGNKSESLRTALRAACASPKQDEAARARKLS